MIKITVLRDRPVSNMLNYREQRAITQELLVDIVDKHYPWNIEGREFYVNIVFIGHILTHG